MTDTLIPLDSTYGSTGPPKIKKKIITKITSIFYMLLGDSFGVKSISTFSWGLEAYNYKKCSVDPCILI